MRDSTVSFTLSLVPHRGTIGRSVYCNTTAVSVTRNRLECARTVHWNEGCVPYLFVGHTVGEVQNAFLSSPDSYVSYIWLLGHCSGPGCVRTVRGVLATCTVHEPPELGTGRVKTHPSGCTLGFHSRLELGPFLMGKSADTRKTHRNPCTGTAVSPCDRRSLSYSLPLKDLKEGSR